MGDQPDDIEKLVRAMIMSYIERPNAIILAVHPANADLATSDALQMAKVSCCERPLLVSLVIFC